MGDALVFRRRRHIIPVKVRQVLVISGGRPVGTALKFDGNPVPVDFPAHDLPAAVVAVGDAAYQFRAPERHLADDPVDAPDPELGPGVPEKEHHGVLYGGPGRRLDIQDPGGFVIVVPGPLVGKD